MSPAPEPLHMRIAHRLGYHLRTAAQVYGEEIFETEVSFHVRFVPQWLLASGPWLEHLGGPAEAD